MGLNTIFLGKAQRMVRDKLNSLARTVDLVSEGIKSDSDLLQKINDGSINSNISFKTTKTAQTSLTIKRCYGEIKFLLNSNIFMRLGYKKVKFKLNEWVEIVYFRISINEVTLDFKYKQNVQREKFLKRLGHQTWAIIQINNSCIGKRART
jgi:hypothetical protein